MNKKLLFKALLLIMSNFCYCAEPQSNDRRSETITRCINIYQQLLTEARNGRSDNAADDADADADDNMGLTNTALAFDAMARNPDPLHAQQLQKKLDSIGMPIEQFMECIHYLLSFPNKSNDSKK